MTLKDKIYNTLAAVALVGTIGGIGGAIYYEKSLKEPECVIQVNQLEREVNEYFGHKEVLADSTIVDEHRKTLDQYEKMLSNSEIVATLEQYDTEKEHRDTTVKYIGFGTLVTMFLGVGSLLAGIKTRKE